MTVLLSSEIVEFCFVLFCFVLWLKTKKYFLRDDGAFLHPNPASYFFFYPPADDMGQNKALVHHTSTHFHTRRVSI